MGTKRRTSHVLKVCCCPRGQTIAGFKDVYDTLAVEKKLQDCRNPATRRARAVREDAALGGQRFAVKPRLPHMTGAVEELPTRRGARAHPTAMALCVDSEDDVELPPILLLGGPGIGKTHFARRVSQLLGTGYGFVPMSSLTAGWVLSGASSQWKNSKPGKVFETFLNGEYANPVLVVDELDKASGDGQYDPGRALRDARDADSMRFIRRVRRDPDRRPRRGLGSPPPTRPRASRTLLNRMERYEIEPPEQQARRASRSHVPRDREAHDSGTALSEMPADGVVEKPRCSRRAKCAVRCRRRSAPPRYRGRRRTAARTWTFSAATASRGWVLGIGEQPAAGEYEIRAAAKRADTRAAHWWHRIDIPAGKRR